MNYSRIYQSIVSRAKGRDLTGTYSELHHVIPRCLGGDDSEENLVRLTPEEHFLCHQLLVKMNPSNVGLSYAAHMMTISSSGHRVNNKWFGWLKRKFSESQKGIVFSEERRKNISKALTGRKTGPMSESAKKKLSIANKGKVRSEEVKQHLSKINTGKKASEETRKKMSDFQKGRPHSKEHNLAVSAAKMGTKKVEVSPGVFKMMKPEQLEEYLKTKADSE